MNIDNILNKIKKEEKKLKLLLEEERKDVAFFDNFISQNSFQGIENLVNIDLCDLLIAYICSKSDKIDFYYAKPRVYSNEMLFNETSNKCVYRVIKEIIELDIATDEEEMEDLKKSRKVKKINDNNEEFITEYTKVEEDSHLGIIDYIDLLELFKKDNDTLMVGTALITSLKKIQEDFIEYQLVENKIVSSTEKNRNKQMSKICKSVIKERISEDYNIENITDVLREVQEYAMRFVKTDKQNKKAIKTNLGNYKELIEFLERNKNKEEITQIPAFLSKIENEEIRVMVLMQIYKNNQVYYNELEKKYNELSTNSINKYKVLFNKYNLDLEKYKIDFSDDINEIEEIINKLSALNITNSEEVIPILNITDINAVNSLFELMSIGYIDQQLVLQNRDLFNKFDGCANLYKNIELFQSKNLSVSNIKRMQNILIKDNEKIKANTKILEKYKLFKHLKKAESYEFLDKEELDKKLDTALELGFEKILKEDLSILNNDDKSWKKIIILNKLNIFIDNKEELNEILNSKNIIPENSNLDDYIFDISKYRDRFDDNLELSKEEFLNVLSNDEKTNNTYNLNGVLISKNKVKRNLKNLEKDILSSKDIFKVIVSNRILDNDEYQNINNYLVSNKKELVKK